MGTPRGRELALSVDDRSEHVHAMGCPSRPLSIDSLSRPRRLASFEEGKCSLVGLASDCRLVETQFIDDAVVGVHGRTPTNSCLRGRGHELVSGAPRLVEQLVVGYQPGDEADPVRFGGVDTAPTHCKIARPPDADVPRQDGSKPHVGYATAKL